MPCDVFEVTRAIDMSAAVGTVKGVNQASLDLRFAMTDSCLSNAKRRGLLQTRSFC